MYADTKITEEKVATQLPEPKGYKVLISTVEVNEKTEAAFICQMASDKQKKQHLSLVLL